jgi:Na+/proline symporter
VLFTTLDWLAIGGYIVFALCVGFVLTRRASRSTQDFYLAGRSLPWWVAGTSLVATSFAADTPLVVSGWVRSGGISQNWLWWGMAVGGALSFTCMAAWWRRLEVTTDAECIERRYDGRAARVLRGFYGGYHALVTNTVVLAWVLLAMLKLVRVVVGAEDDRFDQTIVAVALVLALSYSFLSGLWGVVVTDLFQFFLALGGAILLAYEAIQDLGGFDAAREAFAALPRETTALMPQAGSGWEDLAWWSQGVGAFLIFTAVQGWLNKNADGGGAGVQRYSACRDEAHARGAALWFNLAHYCLRPWPWILVGLASLLLLDPSQLPMMEAADGSMVPDHEAAYPLMMATYLGPGLFGLMCASFLAAFMSTLDTHFNLASAYIVNDVYRRFLHPKASDRHYLWVGRGMEALIGVLAALLALAADSISNLFTFSLSLLGGVGPALLMRWFWWRTNPWTEVAALSTSTILAILFNTTTFGAARPVLDVPYPLSYLMIVGVSLGVSLVVTFLTAPAATERLQAFYAQVRPAGWWGPLDRDGAAKRSLVPLGLCWAGGIALIYGLLFGVGSWLLARPAWPAFACAVVGMVVVKMTWRPALRAPDDTIQT